MKTKIKLTASEKKKQKITNVQHGVKKNNNCLNLLKHESTENQWQVTELKQGKLNSSTVLRTFPLSKSSKITYFSISSPNLVFIIFPILFTRRSLSTLLILAICRTNADLAMTQCSVVSLWLRARELEGGIRRSKVQLLMRTQNFSVFLSLRQDKRKTSFSQGNLIGRRTIFLLHKQL